MSAEQYNKARKEATKQAAIKLFLCEDFRGTIYDPICTDRGIMEAATATGHAGYTDSLGLMEYPRYDIDCIVAEPMSKIDDLLEKALELALYKIAFLLPLEDLASDSLKKLVDKTPLARIYLIEEKLMPRIKKRAWFVWHKGWLESPALRWL